jgi:hypothetical protein
MGMMMGVLMDLAVLSCCHDHHHHHPGVPFALVLQFDVLHGTSVSEPRSFALNRKGHTE